MSDLRAQAYALRETCKTVIASPVKQNRPGGSTLAQAREIISRARKETSDPIVNALDLGDTADWTDVLAAMEAITCVLG